MLNICRFYILLGASLLAACSSMPSGPSFMALPGSSKNFDQFRNDDYQCRQFAHEQVRGTSPEKFSERVNQQRYDTSYVQCMYAKDHRVPVYGQFTKSSNKNDNGSQYTNIPSPPSGNPPPPPSN